MPTLTALLSPTCKPKLELTVFFSPLHLIILSPSSLVSRLSSLSLSLSLVVDAWMRVLLHWIRCEKVESLYLSFRTVANKQFEYYFFSNPVRFVLVLRFRLASSSRFSNVDFFGWLSTLVDVLTW
jgi:hypothetical protein